MSTNNSKPYTKDEDAIILKAMSEHKTQDDIANAVHGQMDRPISGIKYRIGILKKAVKNTLKDAKSDPKPKADKTAAPKTSANNKLHMKVINLIIPILSDEERLLIIEKLLRYETK
jgi:hypothetical protein